MPCPELARLLKLYAQATAGLSDLVRSLAGSAAQDRDSFDRAWEQCESARQLCMQIQQQIYEHLRQHRCAMDIAVRRITG